MKMEGAKTSIQILKARLNGLKVKTNEAKRVHAAYFLDDLLEEAGIPKLSDSEAKKMGVEV